MQERHVTERFVRSDMFEDYAITVRAARLDDDAAWELRVDVIDAEGARCMPANRIEGVTGERVEDIAEVGFEHGRAMIHAFQRYGVEHRSRPPADD